jgi:hypothetical protein
MTTISHRLCPHGSRPWSPPMETVELCRGHRVDAPQQQGPFHHASRYRLPGTVPDLAVPAHRGSRLSCGGGTGRHRESVSRGNQRSTGGSRGSGDLGEGAESGLGCTQRDGMQRLCRAAGGRRWLIYRSEYRLGM